MGHLSSSNRQYFVRPQQYYALVCLQPEAFAGALDKMNDLSARHRRALKARAKMEFKDFDELREEHHFRNNAFLCLVCFVEKLGDQCMRFPTCSHVYCCECMQEYFKVQIGEGMMNNLICPNEGCESRALPTQVYNINVTCILNYNKFIVETYSY